MTAKIINISLPEDLVRKVDLAAKGDYSSRSEYIRQSLVSRLKSEQDYIWESLIKGADEIRTKAEQSGYVSDEDVVRAVKEVRKASRRH